MCYLAPTNSSQDGIRLHLWTISNGPKSRVRHSALSSQLTSLVGLSVHADAISNVIQHTNSLNRLCYDTARFFTLKMAW